MYRVMERWLRIVRDKRKVKGELGEIKERLGMLRGKRDGVLKSMVGLDRQVKVLSEKRKS